MGTLRDGGATLIRALVAENTAKREAVLDYHNPAWDCYTAARVVVTPTRRETYGKRIGRQGCRRDRGCVGHRIGQHRGDVGGRLARGDGRPRRGSAEGALQQARRRSDP